MIVRRRRVIEPFRWEDLTDGLPRRLVRGKHFDLPAADMLEAAREAAARLGKIPRTLVDKTSPERVVWVQFADAEINEGSPCVCGGLHLRRLNGSYARCESCDALLIVQRPERRDAIEKVQQPEAQTVSPEPEEPPSTSQRAKAEKATRAAEKREAAKREEPLPPGESTKPAKQKRPPKELQPIRETQPPQERVDAEPIERRSPEASHEKPQKAKRPIVTSLEHYSDIHLKQYESWPRRSRYRGHGLLPDGRPVLLLVDVPIDEGELLPERLESLHRPHRVASFPIGPFGSAIDVDALDD